MKIAYIDLNHSDCIESYSPRPARYGGGRIIAAALLNRFDDFHIYADNECFSNVSDIKLNQCHSLILSHREAIKQGEPIKKYIANADEYDIFFHHFSHIHLNLEGCRSQKQTVWPVGWREVVHPLNKNVLFFDIDNQQPQLSAQHNIFKIVIGPNFDNFQEYPKEDIIFQCSRHFSHYQSILVAQLALKYNIPTYFAGPIENGYPLMTYIDNRTTHYLGVIDHETKEIFYKRAKLNTQLQDYNISVTLAGKEAASFGCAILATSVGGWKSFIQHGLNGFLINSETDFITAWNKRNIIRQVDCYHSALQFSEDKMIDSVLTALNTINN